MMSKEQGAHDLACVNISFSYLISSQLNISVHYLSVYYSALLYCSMAEFDTLVFAFRSHVLQQPITS